MLPRQCDLSVETHLLPDKVVFDVTCPWNPTFYRTKCSCSVYRYGWQKRYGLQQGCPREDLLISIPLSHFSRGHIRACGLSIAAGLPCPPTPARHLMMPCSALEGGACVAGGPGPHGGFLLPVITASVSHYWKEKPNNLHLG